MSTTPLPAVVTAASTARRFRPFSTHVPKEMLPAGHIPAVECAVVECQRAGATDIIVVTRPGDTIVHSHVRGLRERGLPVTAVPQDPNHGHGNAAALLTLRGWLAAYDVFAVAFGDGVLLDEPLPGWNLAATRDKLRPDTEAVVAGQLVHPSQTGAYETIDTHPDQPGRVARVTVTEPLAFASRLVLRPSIFDCLTPADVAPGELDLGVIAGQLARQARAGGIASPDTGSPSATLWVPETRPA